MTVAGQTSRVCRRSNPVSSNFTPPTVDGLVRNNWPPVQDTDWCGVGADNSSGLSYSASITSGPQLRLGTFTLAASASTTVSEARVDASSQIVLIPTNTAAAKLMAGVESGAWNTGPSGILISAISAGVGFTVAVSNAVAASGTETFAYMLVG